MALPSAVTIGSAGFVVAAAIGLVAVTTLGDDEPKAAPSARSDPDTPAPKASTPPTPSAVTKPTPTHHQPKRHQPQVAVVPDTFVEVYNNSGITGLAAGRAAELEQAGWNVAATDNWYGDIPANTVYYPAQLHRQAVQLAKTMSITRILPAVAPMQFDRLTVILTTAD